MADNIDFNPFEFFERSEVDEDVEKAKPFIEDIILQQKVVTDRELKVRLESRFFPWIVGRALDAMEKGGMIQSVGHVGRTSKRMRATERFFVPYGTPYDSVVSVVSEKRQVTRDINAILTAHAPAGFHAEHLFEDAFLSLGFAIRGREVSEFEGRRVQGIKGKELPNLDFVIERDNVVYGVDVKYWIKYERSTRFEVIAKVRLALQRDIVPFIVARYVDKDSMFTEVIEKGGICYPYRMLLVPSSYESLARRAASLLGYPTLVIDFLPIFKSDFILKLHDVWLERNW